MGMTPERAEELGMLIAKARVRKALSTRALAQQVGVAYGWLSELEAGRFLEPAPDRLAKLSEALNISPARINRLTNGAMTAGLPTPQVYFRAKYGLSADQAARVQRYVDRLRRDA
jgi:transcriptional regulator with XRE-family HTH domain